MIQVTLPDGSIREYEQGITPMQIAQSISESLARNVLCAKVDDDVVDANTPLQQNCTLRLLTWNDEEGKQTFWHSSAHLMAEALEALYPGVKFGVGPALENGGFYYDVDLGGREFSQEHFKALEDKMLECAKKNSEYKRIPISKADAIAYFHQKGDEYKLDLLENLEDGKITFYTQGNFTDLCRGPHIPHTGYIKAVKILSVSGAYWKGDEKNKQLTRIYGITFPKKSELDEYLAQLEEAKKRDHRKIGKEMELFTFSDYVGGGLPLWLPRGFKLRQNLIDFMTKQLYEGGYQLVATPHIAKTELYKISGHLEKYGADSFQPIQSPGDTFFLKPMNCPHHIEIYKSKPRSYRDLPLRIAEFGTVYRYEQSGELNGLTRVRGFTQDDAHIFCTEEQVKGEFIAVVKLVQKVLNKLNFTEYTAQISLRDKNNRDKYIGTDEQWNKAEQAIIDAVAEVNMKTVTEYGEAAFYGPKLDFMVKDAIGRKWQLGTIQVDYQLPERFGLEYVAPDGTKKRPVMLHRAPFGSLERFIGVLIEHCAGDFPLWLAPEQAILLPISEKFEAYTLQVKKVLEQANIRVIVDLRNEKIGKKIRDAELQKIPYMLIIGEKEANENLISIRKRKEGDLGMYSIQEFIQRVQEEIKD
ncbi:MAG: threonine--tRNA ligase [Bacteroidia bacterium]|nr:threonine--tRNA ligase [Bacteroidia bacterium]MDW8301970.1 threonine--tRNA ligase [Bacteroidia bacterium]